jgi:hypothetical protein
MYYKKFPDNLLAVPAMKCRFAGIKPVGIYRNLTKLNEYNKKFSRTGSQMRLKQCVYRSDCTFRAIWREIDIVFKYLYLF